MNGKVGWFLLGLLPFLINATPYSDIAIVSWRSWPGHTKGMEVSIIDLLVFALLLSRGRSRGTVPGYLKWLFALYAVSIVGSMASAQVPMAGLFYLWQTGRIFLLFYLVATTLGGSAQKMALLSGLSIGLVFELLLSLWQRFAMHEIHATGSFGHQNGLGMVCNLAAIPLFTFVLSNGRQTHRLLAMGAIAGLLCSALTVSRAATGLSVLGVLALIVVSVSTGPSPKKLLVLGLMSLGILVAAPLVAISFEKRFQVRPTGGDYDERDAFENAARMMASDNPLGVGSNSYVIVANTGGYSEAAGVAVRAESRTAHVHNVYLLTAAENGYLGMYALIGMLLTPVFSGIKYFRSSVRNADFHLSLLISVAVLCAHSMFEWVLITSDIQYVFAIIFGLLVQSTERLRNEQRAFSLKGSTRNLRKKPGSKPLVGSGYPIYSCATMDSDRQ